MRLPSILAASNLTAGILLLWPLVAPPERFSGLVPFAEALRAATERAGMILFPLGTTTAVSVAVVSSGGLRSQRGRIQAVAIGCLLASAVLAMTFAVRVDTVAR